MKYFNNSIKLFLFILLFIFVGNELKATHAMGGDITYQSIGPNLYRVRLTLYRDCSGVAMSSTETIRIRSVSCSVNRTQSLTRVVGYPVDITPLCPTALSRCSGGSIAYGVQQVVYEGIVSLFTLSPACSDWVISHTLTSRSNAITTIIAPNTQDLYLETFINNTLSSPNRTPTFNFLPTLYACNTQPFSFNCSATDPDGDSLRYSLVPARHSAVTPVSYVSGRSGSSPIFASTPTTIDPTTGIISVTPNSAQVAVICVRVDEFRGGVIINSTIRDIMITVSNCTNTLPTSTGFVGVTGGVLASSNLINVCVGSPLSFMVIGSDVNASQILSFTTNVTVALPGATYTTRGINPDTLIVNWTPTDSSTGINSFNITLVDNNCPLIGQIIKSYEVVVSGVKINASDTIYRCFNLSTPVILKGVGSLSAYTWNVLSGDSASLTCSTCNTISVVPSVNTRYRVEGISSSGCANSDTVTILNIPLFNVNTINDSIICLGNNMVLSTTSSGDSLGVNYLWSPTSELSNPNISNPIALPTISKSYIVRGAVGNCYIYDTVNIDVNRIDTTSETRTSCNLSDTGVFFNTYMNIYGCDSIHTITTNLLPTTSSTSFANICSNLTYNFNGISRNVSGTYLDTLLGSNGCDSFLILNLIVYSTGSSIINQSICAGSTYIFNEVNRNTTGTYLDTFTAVNGCDSVVTLNLIVNLISTGMISANICMGQNYLFNGVALTSAGVYLDTLINIHGCDSFLTLNLAVNPTSTGSINTTICSNQTYSFNGININTSGVYIDTLINIHGCDSILTLYLAVNPTSTGIINATICSNQTYSFNEININTSGVYIDTILNIHGCDSFLTLNLTVNPISTFSINDTICAGTYYEFNGVSITSSGIYRDTLVNHLGCDSFLTLTLTINPMGYISCPIPPINDNMCNALDLTTDYVTTTPYAYVGYASVNTHTETISASNSLSSFQIGEPVGSCGAASFINKTMWYKIFTPNCATPLLHISTDVRTTTDFDTRISVYRRSTPITCSSTFTEIACSDNDAYYLNTGSTNNSTVVLTPNSAMPSTNEYSPGEEIYIQTSGVGSASGNYGLIIDAEPFVPTISSVGAGSAVADWSAVLAPTWGSISGAYIQWRPVGAPSTTAGTWVYKDASSTTHTITGLMPGVAYEVWASYVCGNGGRWWSKKATFTTNATCTVATAPTIVSIVTAPPRDCRRPSVTISAPGIEFSSYKIVRKRGSSLWYSPSYAPSASPITYVDSRTLTYGWTYQYYIVGYCGSTIAYTSPMTNYTACSASRMSDPSVEEETDVVYTLPTGEMMYGMPFNEIAWQMNEGEGEINLQTTDANTYFGRDITNATIETKVGELRVFPNPASEEVTIIYTLENDEPIVEFQILDAQGKTMMNETIINPEMSGFYNVNLNNYSQGIYFVKIKAGDFIETKKLIINKN